MMRKSSRPAAACTAVVLHLRNDVRIKGNAAAAPATTRGQSRHLRRHKGCSNIRYQSNVGNGETVTPPAVWQRHESERQLVPSHDTAPKRRTTTHLH
jgi:hypothetical protein